MKTDSSESWLSPALRPGAALFAAGQWWEAHEAWEEVWRGAQGQDRHFVQGLILLAAALHKRWRHGSTAHRNFVKAQRHLALLPAVYGGVDLARLQRDVWEALQQEGLLPRLHAG